MTLKRALRYNDGTEQIYLLVGWGDGSDIIPPPFITFQERTPVGHLERRFYYIAEQNFDADIVEEVPSL